jgi:hypothetical protein
MLMEVAEGNAPQNFLFCLSKADQLGSNSVAGEELRTDFAARIARTLNLSNAPRVFLVSSRDTSRFDLPALREQLSRERSEREVGQSIERAEQQQESSLRSWLKQQDLPNRAARAQRLAADAKQQIDDRVGSKLLEEMIPSIANDPIQRAGIAGEVFERRIDRWPIVRLLNLVLSPTVTLGETLLRGRLVGSSSQVDRADQLEPMLRPLSAVLQAAMAHLRQSQSAIATAYERDRLWETMHADAAVSRLRDRLAEAVTQQRLAAMKQLGGNNPLAGLGRWLVTIGAAIWFPIVQPILQIVLSTTSPWSWPTAGYTIVSLLSGEKLLQDALFLVIWYVLLWLLIRYRTYGQVRKWLANSTDGPLNLTTTAIGWMDDLVSPLSRQQGKLAKLAERAK